MARLTAWAIWFKGSTEEKEGFCFWKGTHDEGMFYETKEDARNALNREIEKYHTQNDKKKFTIVKVGRIR